MDRLIRFVYRFSLALSAACLVVMTLWTATDVFMRYVYASPIFATGEVTQFLLAFSIFAGLVVITRDREHIRVTLLEAVLMNRAPRFYEGLYSVVSFLGALAVFGILIWKAVATHEAEELSMVMAWPIADIVYGLAALAGLAAFAGFYALFRPGEDGGPGHSVSVE